MSGVLFFWLVWFVVWFAVIALTGYIAHRKQRYVFGWCLLAFILPLIALIFVAILDTAPAPSQRRCPDCYHLMNRTEHTCQACGRVLTEEEFAS